MDEVSHLRTVIHNHADLLFAVVKVALTDHPKVLPPRDGAYLKQRFRMALLGIVDRTLIFVYSKPVETAGHPCLTLFVSASISAARLPI